MGKQRQRGTEVRKRENSNNESKPLEGRDLVLLGLIIQNLSSVIAETDVPR